MVFLHSFELVIIKELRTVVLLLEFRILLLHFFIFPASILFFIGDFAGKLLLDPAEDSSFQFGNLLEISNFEGHAVERIMFIVKKMLSDSFGIAYCAGRWKKNRLFHDL